MKKQSHNITVTIVFNLQWGWKQVCVSVCVYVHVVYMCVFEHSSMYTVYIHTLCMVIY